MANRTVKEAVAIKGTNPQYLIEKIVRSRIYDSRYWKEECFALTAELLVDKGMELRYLGGTYGGNIKPTPFICLTLKMLQIQPEKDIIVEFIKSDFKYVRALGAFYMRLVGTSIECYKYLEPLLNDFRKLRYQNREGKFELIHMDEFVDQMLREERVCDVILPRIQKRHVLEEGNDVEPRVSALEEALEMDEDEEMDSDTAAPMEEEKPPKSSKDKDRHRQKTKEKDRDDRKRHRSRSREREREDRDRKRVRSRSRTPERDRDRHRISDRRRKSPERRDRDRETKDRRDRDRDEKDRSRDKDRDKKKSKDKRDKDDKKTQEQEIAEANALRAKLGLAPLRP
nr:EOG090X0DXI [Triops cancriformis]